ncbi:unnamed protein product [Cunninghamella blakesleeana]
MSETIRSRFNSPEVKTEEENKTKNEVHTTQIEEEKKENGEIIEEGTVTKNEIDTTKTKVEEEKEKGEIVEEDDEEEEGRRTIEYSESETEEVDEFGRVKKRRYKFERKKEIHRKEMHSDNEEDDKYKSYERRDRSRSHSRKRDIERSSRRRSRSNRRRRRSSSISSYSSRSPSPYHHRKHNNNSSRSRKRRHSYSDDDNGSSQSDNDSLSDSSIKNHKSSHRHKERRKSSPSSRKRYGYDDDNDDHYHHRYTSNGNNSRSHHHRHGSRYGNDDQYDDDAIDRKIYIGDLLDISRKELEDVFSKFGPVSHIKLIDGKDYGFITFKHSSSAKEAIEEMNGAVVGGGKIKVNRAKMIERQHRSAPWVDEDGRLSDMLEPITAVSQFQAIEQPPIQRTLTNYDDIL